MLSNYYYFNIAAALLLGVVTGWIIDRVVELRMVRQNVPTEENLADENASERGDRDVEGNELSVELSRPHSGSVTPPPR